MDLNIIIQVQLRKLVSIRFQNENNKSKSYIHSILNTDNTSVLNFGVTGSGVARDADSRTQY